MISLMENIIKNMGVYHGFEKNETATMFFLKKPPLVIVTSSSSCMFLSGMSVCFVIVTTMTITL